MKRSYVRLALALAVAAMGAIDLGSALLSHPPDRLVAMRHLVPTDVLDTSRTFTLLAGALLLVTASGLARGKRLAFVGALLLCAVSVPVNLLKSFDFEEATVAAALMFLLGVAADSFRVRSRQLTVRALRSRALWTLVGFAVFAIAGCWALEAQFGLLPSPRHAAAEALYRVLGIGDPALTIPAGLPFAQQYMADWFLQALPLIGLSIVLVLGLAALRPARHRVRHRRETERVAGLVRAYGDSSVCAFALDPEADYFFSTNDRAVIAYRFESDALLVIGDPIGPPEEFPALLGAFAAMCREYDWRFAFFQARPERLADYRRLGWRALHIGEDPILWAASFTLEGSHRADVRRLVNRVKREGVEARLFFPGTSSFDAANDPDEMLEQMKALSLEWLAGKHGGEKGFCMGRFDPARLEAHALAVAWSPAARRVEAFCTLVPIPARRGWTLDLMRRRSDAVQGATEFLIVKSLAALKVRGDALLSLSLSALARVPSPGETPGDGAEDKGAAAAVGAAPAPATPAATFGGKAIEGEATGTEEAARGFLMDVLARYYDFKGLFHWKQKFDPTFEDRYLVFSDPLALPRVARALIRIQSPAGLSSYLPWKARRS